MAGATRNTEGHFAAGDGVRAVAALLVVLFHGYVSVALLARARGQELALGGLGDVLVRLNIGVYVFFVLSGYLVGGPYVRAWLRGGGYPRPGPYLVRRARRIVPAFVVVVLGIVAWHGTAGGSTGDILVVLLFGQVWLPVESSYVLTQGWTLDIEVMFYLALPLLALGAARLTGPRGPRGRLVLLLAMLCLLGVLGALWRRGPAAGTEEAGARHLGTFAWAFLPGLLLAALEPAAARRLAGRLAGRALAAALGLAGVGSILVLAAAPGLVEGRLATMLLYATCGGGIVGGALVWQWATGAAPPGLASAPARALGRWSYGIYLVHLAVGTEAMQHVPAAADSPGAILAWIYAWMLAGSVVLAAGLWWLVEQPVLTGRRPVLGRPGRARARVPTGVPPSAVPAPGQRLVTPDPHG